MFPDMPVVPEDTQREILSYLSPQELSTAATVSRAWNEMANKDVVWQNLLETSFSPELIADSEEIHEKLLEILERNNVLTDESRIKLAKTKYTYRICKLLHDNYLLDKSRFVKDMSDVSNTSKMFYILIRIFAINDVKEVLLLLANKTFSLDFSYKHCGGKWFYKKIDNVIVEVIAEALKNPICRITDLNFSSNQISDVGAMAIVDALKNPICRVTNLDLSFNQIGDSGVIAIVDVLEEHGCKITINLVGNPNSEAVTKLIAKASLNRKANDNEYTGIVVYVERIVRNRCCWRQIDNSRSWCDYDYTRTVTVLADGNHQIADVGTVTYYHSFRRKQWFRAPIWYTSKQSQPYNHTRIVGPNWQDQ